MKQHFFSLIAIAIVSMLSACANPYHVFDGPGENLPTHTWRNSEQALRNMTLRDSGIYSMRMRGNMLLVEPDRSITLEVILLIDLKRNALRMRAFKLGRTVLDITANNDGVFVYDASADKEVDHTRENVTNQEVERDAMVELLAKIPQALKRMHRSNIWADAKTKGESGNHFFLDYKGATLTFDKLTLVPMRVDFPNTPEPTYLLLQYQPVSPKASTKVFPTPTHARLHAPEGRVIQFTANKTEINLDLPKAAFVAPSTADKIE